MSTLVYTTTAKNDGRIERSYYIDSKYRGNRIGSSNRINNWDSEEKTLKEFVKDGLTAKQIREFSQPVTVDEKMIKPISRYQGKGSELRIELFRNGEYIQSIRLGTFSDKYIGFYNAHELAKGILTNNLREIQVASGRTVKIKEEFYRTIPEIDLLNTELSLQEELLEKDTELLDLQVEIAALKRENEELKVQHSDDQLLLDMYRYDYRMEEVVKCPDCGAERRRLWSNKTESYFLGCSSGEQHLPRVYDRLAKLCFKEGLIRDIWVENSEDPEYYYSHEYVKGKGSVK